MGYNEGAKQGPGAEDGLSCQRKAQVRQSFGTREVPTGDQIFKERAVGLSKYGHGRMR